MKRLLLLGILIGHSVAWGLEPVLHQPAPHYQIPLEKEFKHLLSGKGRKDPAIAVLLAGVPPVLAVQGLGQAYNGEIGKGMFFFGIGQLSYATWATGGDATTTNIGRAVFIGSGSVSTIDAYRSAMRINRRRGHPKLLTPLPRPASAYTWRRSP